MQQSNRNPTFIVRGKVFITCGRLATQNGCSSMRERKSLLTDRRMLSITDDCRFSWIPRASVGRQQILTLKSTSSRVSGTTEVRALIK
jgi:hypothetical protein